MIAIKNVFRRRAATVAMSVPAVRRFLTWEHARVYAVLRDGWNQTRYGPDAPMFAERLWIDPLHVHFFDRTGSVWKSASVEEREWSTDKQKLIEDDPILQASIARWRAGLPWEETGEVERMERAIRRKGPIHGCRNREDILQRCARLDEIFHVIQHEGKVRAQAEVEPRTFREFGGIGIHIGPNGRLIRAGNGRHRFAMARILRIPLIPVRIGVVHHSALPLLEELRHERNGLPRPEPVFSEDLR